MKQNIKLLTKKLKNISTIDKLWKKVTIALSCIAVVFTFYFLMSPAITENVTTKYNLHLIDSFTTSFNEVYAWKSTYKTNYDLELYYVDTLGNPIEGKDLTIDIGPDSLNDDPHGFGYIPYADTSKTTTRGTNLIDVLNIYEISNSTGEIYQFDHAEVYVNNQWQVFGEEGYHWNIFCQGSSSITKPESYGWRGTYAGDGTDYTVDENTKYKFVYKEIRYGQKHSVASLGADSGISFKIYNYSGRNDQQGDNNINNNGVYNWFTFRGMPDSTKIPDPSKNYGENYINYELDGDGYYNDTRIKVLPNLNESRNPIFNCQGTTGCTDFSLGYLFGETTNPAGTKTQGVTPYNSTNTLLQKDSEGNYYYDSNLNAVDYDTVNQKFILRDYLERSYTMTVQDSLANRYEFMPFNYWSDAMTLKTNPDTGHKYNYEDEGDETQGRPINAYIDHWFGMTMELNFYMPKNGKIDEKDMIFSFSGDDDVWVFIDDVLVLDIGGTHGVVNGTINFATGEVKSYLNWGGVIGTEEDNRAINTNIYQMYNNAGKTSKTDWNGKTYENYTYHTLKFFYLERGASVSNCSIKFNIPVLPSGALSVQKQFSGTDKYNENYEFTLYDTTSGEDVPVANTKYTIGENEYYTDENGKFTLKNTQTALFTLTNYHTYYVKETNAGQHAQSLSCTLNSTACPSINQTSEFTINPESLHQAIFTNEIKKYDLNINKIVNYDINNNYQFSFKLTLKDKENKPVDIPDAKNSEYTVDHQKGIITFKLKHGENVNIKDIPIDTKVTLEEINHDGYQVIIKSGTITLANGDTYNFNMDANKNITVYNQPGVLLPATGGTGTTWYLLIGIILIVISTKFGYKYLFNNQEEGV